MKTRTIIGITAPEAVFSEDVNFFWSYKRRIITIESMGNKVYYPVMEPTNISSILSGDRYLNSPTITQHELKNLVIYED